MVRRRYFGHISPGGSSPISRVLGAGYRSPHRVRVGENILTWSIPLTPAEVVQKWMASPPHRRDILRRRWREVGMALVNASPSAGGGITVVVEFGRRT